MTTAVIPRRIIKVLRRTRRRIIPVWKRIASVSPTVAFILLILDETPEPVSVGNTRAYIAILLVVNMTFHASRRLNRRIQTRRPAQADNVTLSTSTAKHSLDDSVKSGQAALLERLNGIENSILQLWDVYFDQLREQALTNEELMD